MKKLFFYLLSFMAAVFSVAGADGTKNLFGNPAPEKALTQGEYKKINHLRGLKGSPLPQLPEDWGIFMGGVPVKVEWGMHRANDRKCFYMKLLEDIDNARSRLGIIIGDCSGVDGGGRAIVNNSKGCKYCYSFMISGNAGAFEVRILTWKKGEMTAKHTGVNFSGNPVLSEKWEKIEGSFTLPEDVERFALVIILSAASKDKYVAASDAVIESLPVPEMLGGGRRFPLKIGIYSGIDGHAVSRKIISQLEASGKLKIEEFSSLKKEDLFQYDVVVLSDVSGLSKTDAGKSDNNIKETDFVTNLLEFVDSGRGLVLGCGCFGDGIFGKSNMFPEFIRDITERKGKNLLKKEGAPSRITEGLPQLFEWEKENLFTFRTGKTAVPLIAASDKKTVLAESGYPRGKVVASGLSFAESTDPKMDAYKKDLLEKSIFWAGSGELYKTDPAVTRMGLLAAVRKAEASDAKEDLDKYIRLPKPRFDEKIMFSHIYRLKTEEQLRELVKNVKDMGFDGLVVNSVLKKTSYPSRYYDKNAMISSIDQLDVLVRECRKVGLKCGFTFSLFMSCQGSPDPADFPHNIPKEDYLAGKKLWPKEYWLCPDYPGVQERGLKVVREQIEKYHPDYMYIDFIRYCDDYASSCYCDYSRARKKEFSEANPNIKPENIDAAFAEKTLTEYTRKFHRLCKELDPGIKTVLYTMTPNESDDKWLFKYPVDWHIKYVSRSLEGIWRPVDTVEKFTIRFNELNRKKNPVADSEFLPMIAGRHGFPGEPCKSPERLEAEVKLLSATLDKIGVKKRLFLFYEYMHLADPDTNELRNEYREMFSRLLK